LKKVVGLAGKIPGVAAIAGWISSAGFGGGGEPLALWGLIGA